MGLAASQGRLLMLTARKDDIEAGLMNIANQKLALSRQSAKMSEDYSAALNAKTLVWTTDNSNTTDLSYDLLMRPNTSNESGQYIITNATTNKVILDDNYISGLGLPASGNAGDITNTISKSEFLQKLIGCDETTADDYVNDDDAVKNGETTLSNFTTNYSDDGDFLANNKDLLTIYSNNKLNLGSGNDLLSNFASCLEGIASAASSSIAGNIASKLGDSAYKAVLNEAISYAEQATYAKFVENTVDTDSTDGVALTGTTKYGSSGSNQIFKSGDNGYIDGKQLINTFLNFFDMYCAQNFGGTYDSTKKSVGAKSTTRSGDGGTGTATGAIPDDTTSTTTTTTTTPSTSTDVNNNNISDSYEASFYLNLYSAISDYGWQSMDFAGTSANLEAQVMNGNINIRQAQSDGNWNVTTTNSLNSPLTTENVDVTKAEAEYDAKKDQLSAKESALDINMNNLDTERSAITTEIESLQSVIKKRIEGSFKMFDA